MTCTANENAQKKTSKSTPRRSTAKVSAFNQIQGFDSPRLPSHLHMRVLDGEASHLAARLQRVLHAQHVSPAGPCKTVGCRSFTPRHGGPRTILAATSRPSRKPGSFPTHESQLLGPIYDDTRRRRRRRCDCMLLGFTCIDMVSLLFIGHIEETSASFCLVRDS